MMKILRMFQRRKDLKPLEGYLSPEVIEKLLRETKSEPGPLEVKHFQFVVILVDETDSREIPAIIVKVLGTLIEKQMLLSNITSSLLIGTLGVPFPEGNSPEVRREIVGALLRENCERIRVAHGECDGAFGTYGGHGRWTYGPVIPGFSAILEKLLETKFGTAVEIA
jgi:hypothetical protein